MQLRGTPAERECKEKLNIKRKKGRKRGLRLGSTDAEALVNYNCDTRGKNVISRIII